MRVAPFSVTTGDAGSQATVKVCMHILRPARTDYRLMRTATTLAKTGCAVFILDVESERVVPGEEDIDEIRLKHMIIPTWFTARSSQLRFFLTALRTFMVSIRGLMQSRADIYHALELTALPACYIVAMLRRKPLIFEAYELHIPAPETDIAFWRPLGGLFVRILAFILPHCAGVIVTTPLYAQEFRNHFRISNIYLVRNIPVYEVVRSTNRLREHLALREDTRIALYQGGLQRNRGLDKLVRAAAFLEPDIVIVLMGKAMGTTQSELEALIASENVADRIKIIPPVLYEERLEWTTSADIGLVVYTPDYSLAVKMILPNKVFEYMMAGVPILATELDAVVEIISTYDVGQVVSSAAPSSIGAAINSMLKDRNALAHMRHNALEAARKEFNWEKESQQLLRLYASITKQR